MELNYLLSRNGIDTKKTRVLVMRHVPTEPDLRKALPWLAADRPDLFNGYQEIQSPHAEKQLAQAAYLASFIGHKAGEALFVGLYKVKGHRRISRRAYWKKRANIELRKLGMKGWSKGDSRSVALWFDLDLMDIYQEWKGKLIVNWPPPEISWTRWANDNEFFVKAIIEESYLDKGMPHWSELVLTWDQLAHLPKRWVDILSQWRGVYFIL